MADLATRLKSGLMSADKFTEVENLLNRMKCLEQDFYGLVDELGSKQTDLSGFTWWGQRVVDRKVNGALTFERSEEWGDKSPVFSFDWENGAFRFNYPVYSTGEVSAYGVGTASAGGEGGGGGLDEITLWEILGGSIDNKEISKDHLPSDLFAKTTWGDITGRPTWLDSMVGSKPNISAWRNDVGYITDAALIGLATKEELKPLATKKELEGYVDLTSKQTITGVKEFVNGFTIGGIRFVKDGDAIKIDGDLYATGEVSAYGKGVGTQGGGLAWEDLEEWDGTDRKINEKYLPEDFAGVSKFADLTDSPYANALLANALNGKADRDHTHSQYLTANSTLDATKLSGVVPLASIPNVNFERLPDLYWANVKVSNGGSIETTPTFKELFVAQTTHTAQMELTGASSHGGYIDFHYGATTADYTTRLMESGSGILSLTFGNTTKKQLFINAGNSSELRIGNYILCSSADGLQLKSAISEQSANFYATGEVSAYGKGVETQGGGGMSWEDLEPFVWEALATADASKKIDKSHLPSDLLGETTWEDIKGTVPTWNQDTTGTAAAAESIVDYNSPSGRIKVGYQGASLTADDFDYFAAYASINGSTVIKDLSGNTAMRIIQSEANGSGDWGINALTATSLETARSLWGNSFNGSRDINGDIQFSGNTEKRVAWYEGTAPKRGLYLHSNGLGLYDWNGGGGLFGYDGDKSQININAHNKNKVCISGYTPFGDYNNSIEGDTYISGKLRIGNYVLVSTIDGLQVMTDGAQVANLYATGEISAYGKGGGTQGGGDAFALLDGDNTWTGVNSFKTSTFGGGSVTLNSSGMTLASGKGIDFSGKSKSASSSVNLPKLLATKDGTSVVSTLRSLDNIIEAVTWLLAQHISKIQSEGTGGAVIG